MPRRRQQAAPSAPDGGFGLGEEPGMNRWVGAPLLFCVPRGGGGRVCLCCVHAGVGAAHDRRRCLLLAQVQGGQAAGRRHLWHGVEGHQPADERGGEHGARCPRLERRSPTPWLCVSSLLCVLCCCCGGCASMHITWLGCFRQATARLPLPPTPRWPPACVGGTLLYRGFAGAHGRERMEHPALLRRWPSRR